MNDLSEILIWNIWLVGNSFGMAPLPMCGTHVDQVPELQHLLPDRSFKLGGTLLIFGRSFKVELHKDMRSIWICGAYGFVESYSVGRLTIASSVCSRRCLSDLAASLSATWQFSTESHMANGAQPCAKFCLHDKLLLILRGSRSADDCSFCSILLRI